MQQDSNEQISTNHPLLAGLNPEQHKAVLHYDGPLLILAGAGSGKTRVITHRIAYMIQERGISPRSILAITFTNKAAKEMKERVEQLVGDVTSSMWIGTFHSMMARVLRRFAEIMGYTRTFAIADTADQLSQIRAVLKEMNLDEKTFEPRRIQNSISSAKNKLVDPGEYKKQAQGEYWRLKVAEVYERYQNRLRQSNLMDFDDLLFNSVRLFQNNPDILRLYQDRFQYIMVDEYQDTNGAQYELIRLLSMSHKNLCVVGDDDQSIYSFRGADIQNILDFEKDFKNCTVIKLEQNYRSTANILKAANQVIHNNSSRKSKKLWTASGEGEKITKLSIYDERSESMYIASEIQRMVNAGECNYRDIGILYRLNALSRNIEFALQRSSVPFKIFGGLRFFDRKEIKDTMAYLNLISSPRDNNAFRRAVGVPKRGIGDTSILELERIALENGVSIMEVCIQIDHFPELSRAATRVKDFVQLIGRMQKTLLENAMTLAEYIEYVQNESGLVQEIIDKQEKGREDAYTRLENLKELLSEAVNFQENSEETDLWDFTDEELSTLDEASLRDIRAAQAQVQEQREGETLLQCLMRFLDQAALQSDLDLEAVDDDNNYVSLMTIHSAKGLEFDVVFVVGMEEGIFPGYRSIADPKAIEEERRLAYVAITRARKKLTLSNSDSRLLFGRTERYIPSRFLEELPEETIQTIGSSAMSSASYGRDSGDSRSSSFDYSQTANSDRKPVFGFARSPLDDLRMEQKKAKAIQIPKAGNLRAEDISKGDKVRHNKFGNGTVLAVEPVAGDAIVQIRFDRFGEKKLMANAANLGKQEEK